MLTVIAGFGADPRARASGEPQHLLDEGVASGETDVHVRQVVRCVARDPSRPRGLELLAGSLFRRLNVTLVQLQCLCHGDIDVQTVPMMALRAVG